jgi:predicted dehydrogenase
MARQPLRLCIVGLGHIGRVHVSSLQQIDALRLVAGCDSNPALAEVLPQGVRFHGSLDAALAATDVDVVVVATPNQTHNRIAIQALEAGLHVMVEKPAASDPAELEALQASAQRSGRLLWFALHAATGSEVIWAERHLREEGERYGALTGFHSRFMDPYIDPLNRQLSHADSLQTPWRDSGINAVSVLLRLQPSLQLEPTGLRCSRQLGERPCILSETAHFRFGNAGYGCMETAWDQQRNHKSTELFFAGSGMRLLIDHSQQTVERWSSDGGHETLAAFDGDRLINHYLNLFSEAAAALGRGEDNAQEGIRAHAPYFATIELSEAS